MIPGLQSIVVGIELAQSGELSVGSRLSVERARWLAAAGGVRVTLLHAPRREEHGSEGELVERSPRIGGDFRRPLEAALQALRAAGIDAELALSEERAGLAIVKRVLQLDADLVIVGKRSHPEHDGRLLGSVSRELLRKCPCAVWVVKPDGSADLATILAATDRSPVGRRVIEMAASLAAECGAQLHIVHALMLPMSVQIEGDDAQEQFVAQGREAAQAEISAQLPESLRAAARFHIGLTSPSNAILACVDRLEPDLVVMGTVSRAGIAGLLVGNTAERMLEQLDCSLLTVKPADFVCPVALD